MQISFDPRYNIAYLRFGDRPAEVETVTLGEDINVDIAPDGTVYGIELLNANAQLLGGAGTPLVIINDATGARREAALP